MKWLWGRRRKKRKSMEGKLWKNIMSGKSIYEIHNDVMTTSSVARRDRLVVTTLRCGRSNPGSNPGHGIFFVIVFFFSETLKHSPLWGLLCYLWPTCYFRPFCLYWHCNRPSEILSIQWFNSVYPLIILRPQRIPGEKFVSTRLSFCFPGHFLSSLLQDQCISFIIFV